MPHPLHVKNDVDKYHFILANPAALSTMAELNAEQFLGRKWSVITRTNMRYVGLMVDFNMEDSTFRLKDGMQATLSVV